ncbi:hypothetical protein QJS04_geneDACA012353 [Acorus gramineus]|uniref:Uncharacterized protein n=1 Tax=Acorus gramineus TaxID=55184 RepID=A0AAV9B7P4_ACOGR|nr:hypothetical protein QJS04_geneDACA012353 [Acorus gramineus]
MYCYQNSLLFSYSCIQTSITVSHTSFNINMYTTRALLSRLHVLWGDVVDEGEGVAGDLHGVLDARAHGVPEPSFDGRPGESVHARALVRQGRADPCLGVANVPRELRGLGPARVAQLAVRAGQPVHGVAHVLHAVADRARLPGADALRAGQAGDEGVRGPGALDADGKRGLREVFGVVADGGGVGGEALDAEGGVAGGAA